MTERRKPHPGPLRQVYMAASRNDEWGILSRDCETPIHGPLAIYVKLWVRMRRECRERFPVTAGKRSRHASRHVRQARAVMHAGIAN